MSAARRPPVSVPSRIVVALIAGLTVGLVLWVGCAPRTTQVESPAAVPEAFSLTGGVDAPSQWWTAFHEPALDRLVDEALTSNLDLAAVWQRLRAARAVAKRAGADLRPSVDAAVDASVRRSGDTAGFGGPDDDDPFGDDPLGDDEGGDDAGDVDELRLGLAASYEVDLWGRLRAGVEAETLRAQAQLSDYRTAALTLAAEVAGTFVQRVEARARLDLLDDQLETNETVEDLLEHRLAAGQIRGVDLLRQRQLVEATRGERIAAAARLRVLDHQLAVLVGRPPRADVAEAFGLAAVDELPALPALPATGVPLELVRRRPDLRRAAQRLQAADRDLAAAMAARYPRLTLTASVTTVDDGAAELFDTWIRRLAGGLLAPLLRGGALDAEVDRAEASKQQLVFDYGQATLRAFQDVEDALVREEAQRRVRDSLERRVELGERAERQLRVEYLNGSGDYIDVLLALTDTQRLRREQITAQRLVLEQRIGLYRALAGPIPTARESPP